VIIHLVGAILLEQNDEWAVALQALETIALLSEYPLVGPPDGTRPSRQIV
jgi:hypothetical protein